MTCCNNNNLKSTSVNSCCGTDGITATAQIVTRLRMYLQNQGSAMGTCSSVFSASERQGLLDFLNSVRDFMTLEEINGVNDPNFPRFFMLIMHTVNLRPEFPDAVDYFVNGRGPPVTTPDPRPDAATILANHQETYANAFLFFGLIQARRSRGTNGVAIDFLLTHDYSRYSSINSTSPAYEAIQKLSTGAGNLCGNTLVMLTEPTYILNGNLLGLNPDTMNEDPCRNVEGPAGAPPGIYVSQSVKENAFSFNTTGDELLYGRITLLSVNQDNWVQAMIASRIGLLDDQRWKLTLPPDFYDRCALEDRSAVIRQVAKKAGYLFNPDGLVSSSAGGSSSCPAPSPYTTSLNTYPSRGPSCGNDSDVEDDFYAESSCGPTRKGMTPAQKKLYNLNVALASETVPDVFPGEAVGNSCIEIDKRVPRPGTLMGVLSYLATNIQRINAIVSQDYANRC